ncbi:hypothetical protein FOXG_16281 [Fusarium oxysporum f. sp. lycopersici 4287]|uniref:Uncharacterized protein n=2 Tax=Fusarium oxysporum TaxID=5507 RepID=A0A0J9WM52_FUSO4|nr:hypothetical protein FOXG_06912 [Fusarium oxysporum f. sp. lycopersici 4287]XP_018256650.1 hypothetical protein FOXG_16099 [Fusarium oxysporum f. sp. lycopersici 4287]XP_018256918.1 hypothetical protein FOXG_16281 [Fusarium oxysporum f. sp. lycopersici 4287]KNB04927.1 hypothetical protein FOXG_06912 [Fusarium oxysporum f. sp. lycopersici 4287]KNB18605.1 hypothetical protein FOXG_16099 [Fusarium oxysporum f. sp. lycopersici 4287]KNB18873.1 hypothetical protein FOXG_16281 [Fusarium oxysporum 
MAEVLAVNMESLYLCFLLMAVVSPDPPLTLCNVLYLTNTTNSFRTPRSSSRCNSEAHCPWVWYSESCAEAGATPAAIGALAVLYDVTCLYPGQARSSLTAKKWASLPSDVLNTRKVPLNRNYDGGASLTNPFPRKQPLKVEGLRKSIAYLGRHFFNAAGVPTFDLDKANQLLIAKKIDGIKAPASAPAGPEGTGAVDWLYLGDAGGSQGVSLVYRVLTAGGASHGCKAKGTDSTSYTALYWFYG